MSIVFLARLIGRQRECQSQVVDFIWGRKLARKFLATDRKNIALLVG
jgi:hypothetical protein